MADEVTVQLGLTVRKNNLNHRPPMRTFKADLTTPVGPTVGAIIVTTEGTDVEFTELVDPGWCMITNQEDDEGSSIEIGLYDPETNRFYPMFVIEPGWAFGPVCFDPSFQWEEYPAGGTGTGTGTGGYTNRLRLRAKAHACYALVEAFER